MYIGKIIGSVRATRKEEGLTGMNLLIFREERYNEDALEQLLVVADRIGAGVGDRVIVTTGGASRVNFSEQQIPIDALIVGIVDSIERG